MKVDVEGHESSVFAGAAEWIERVEPEIFLFEHDDGESLWDAPGFDVLRRGEYRFFGVPKVTMRMRVIPLVAGQRTRPAFHGLLAVHPSCDWMPPS